MAKEVFRRISPNYYVEFYKANDGWRWRAYHNNGNIVADSGQGYSRHKDARKVVMGLWPDPAPTVASETPSEPSEGDAPSYQDEVAAYIDMTAKEGVGFA